WLRLRRAAPYRRFVIGRTLLAGGSRQVKNLGYSRLQVALRARQTLKTAYDAASPFTNWRCSSAGGTPAAPSPARHRRILGTLRQGGIQHFARRLAELAAGIIAQHLRHGGLQESAQPELADAR